MSHTKIVTNWFAFFTVISLLLTGVGLHPLPADATTFPAGTSVASEQSGAGEANAVYLPLVLSGAMNAGTANIPLRPDTYASEGSTPPTLPPDPNATECASFIDFTNFSNETVYIYWVGRNKEEMRYKVLNSGRHYWQHTYRYNQWRIRDDADRLIFALTVEGCENTKQDIFIDDLPPCGGILQIGLWDLVREEALEEYAELTDGMKIDLSLLPPAVIHIEAQSAVESIEVLGGGAVVALNTLPYNYPPNEEAWSPAPGTYTLIFNAYRKDNAVGTICDSREITVTISQSATPTATASPSSTVTQTATPSGTPAPTGTQSPTATLTSTPSFTPTPSTTVSPTLSPTPTDARCGRIESIQFYDLDRDEPVAIYAPLQNGMIIVRDRLPQHFNIDVTLSGAAQSLLFSLNGDQSLENRPPYRYPGADITPWEPTVGGYTLVATAYALADAAGDVCDQKIVNFTLIDSIPTATPTATATPLVTPTPSPSATSTVTPVSTPTPTATPIATSTPTSTLTPTPTPTQSGGDTCIGDWAWSDTNGNALQDAGEPGLRDIEIYVWADDNRDGLRDRIVAATATDASGTYAVCGLDATLIYIVEFSTPPQCRFTLADQGGNEALDSDAIPVSGLTTPIQLTAGQVNHTIDAGYICGE